MVDAVQRPRGPMGWSPTYAHLGWPSDVTPERMKQWRREYDAGMMESGKPPPARDDQVPPLRNPTHPPETSSTPGLTGKTRYRLGWRGRLVLQVEYTERRAMAGGWVVPKPYTVRCWRDATVEDLQALYQDGGKAGPDGHR